MKCDPCLDARRCRSGSGQQSSCQGRTCLKFRQAAGQFDTHGFFVGCTVFKALDQLFGDDRRSRRAQTDDVICVVQVAGLRAQPHPGKRIWPSEKAATVCLVKDLTHVCELIWMTWTRLEGPLPSFHVAQTCSITAAAPALVKSAGSPSTWTDEVQGNAKLDHMERC